MSFFAYLCRQFVKLTDKKMTKSKFRTIAILMLAMLFLNSCKSELKRKHFVGTWKLTAIDSRIDGVLDEDASQNVGESCYTFCSDSTYQLVEDEDSEQGIWSFADSTLAKMPSDSTEYIYFSVEKCDEDTLIITLPNDTTEFGVISERRIFVKQKEEK